MNIAGLMVEDLDALNELVRAARSGMRRRDIERAKLPALLPGTEREMLARELIAYGDASQRWLEERSISTVLPTPEEILSIKDRVAARFASEIERAGRLEGDSDPENRMYGRVLRCVIFDLKTLLAGVCR